MKLKQEIDNSDHLIEIQRLQVSEFVKEAKLKKQQIDLKARQKQADLTEMEFEIQKMEVELQILLQQCEEMREFREQE